MLWLWVLVIVVLVGAATVLAVGSEDSLGDVYDDRPDRAVPTGRPLTADDLREVTFTTAVRGYRMDEVDALMARVRDDLATREARQHAPEPAASDETTIGGQTAPPVGRPGGDTGEEASADPASDSAPDPAPDLAPDVSPDPAPDMSADPAPHPAADPTPGSGSSAVGFERPTSGSERGGASRPTISP